MLKCIKFYFNFLEYFQHNYFLRFDLKNAFMFYLLLFIYLIFLS